MSKYEQGYNLAVQISKEINSLPRHARQTAWDDALRQVRALESLESEREFAAGFIFRVGAL